MSGWEFWVDRGGTFTDVIGRSPDGKLFTNKLLSHDPRRSSDAAAAGIAGLLDRAGAAFAPESIAGVRMGTTVATNALLERRGESTCLAITSGFGDALRIGHQARPRLFDLDIKLPLPLYDRVIEIDERVGCDGTVVRELDEERAGRDLGIAFRDGYRAIAIVLMHGWRFTAHEARLAELARATGFTQVSVSHEVAPLVRLLPRGATTVSAARSSAPA